MFIVGKSFFSETLSKLNIKTIGTIYFYRNNIKIKKENTYSIIRYFIEGFISFVLQSMKGSGSKRYIYQVVKNQQTRIFSMYTCVGRPQMREQDLVMYYLIIKEHFLGCFEVNTTLCIYISNKINSSCLKFTNIKLIQSWKFSLA